MTVMLHAPDRAEFSIKWEPDKRTTYGIAIAVTKGDRP